MTVRPIRNLAASAGYLRAHPVVSLALGGALVAANVAVCCGFGALAAPWFGCELAAFQLGIATGGRRPRTRAWLGAGVIVLGAVLIVSAAAWITILGLGADMPVVDGPPQAEHGDLKTVALGTAGVVLALIYILPLIYTTPILIDRGGTFGGAVLESARIVHADGFVDHLGLSVLAHLVQLFPVLLTAGVAAATLERTIVPLAVLASTPLLAITIPLGQGTIAAAWVERRDRLVDPVSAVRAGHPPRLLTVFLAVVIVAPAISLCLVGASLARPSRASLGGAPQGEVLVDAEIDRARELRIPGTALMVATDPRGVSIEASDGGGVGRLPLGGSGAVERVRVVRVRSSYAVEATRGGEPRVVWVDRAGVRLDDHLRARFADRMPDWGLVALALSLLLIPIVLGRVVAGLADVRRHAASGVDEGLDALRRRAVRHAWLAGLLVLPFSAAATAAGIAMVS